MSANGIVWYYRRFVKLDSTGIVPILDHGELDGHESCFYLVLKFIEGRTLADELKSRSRLSSERCVELVSTIAESLSTVHEAGYTHRDLKPSNILLDQVGKPFITDFGLAIHEDIQRQHVGELAGTLPYMSPEQLKGKTDDLDGSDIWSLGVMFYQMLTGRLPFCGSDSQELISQILKREPTSPTQIDSSIPLHLEEICLKCLSKDISKRYTSGSALAAALQEPDTDGPIPTVVDHGIQIGNIYIVSTTADRAEQSGADEAEASDDQFGDNPYRGLETFHEHEAHLFFGRKEQTRQTARMTAESDSNSSTSLATTSCHESFRFLAHRVLASHHWRGQDLWRNWRAILWLDGRRLASRSFNQRVVH